MENFQASDFTWLVTGCAGFIGSHLVEQLLKQGAAVQGLDNFLTGHKHNLSKVKAEVGDKLWQNFEFIEGDIRCFESCKRATQKVDLVLHQAALGSVPRSVANPLDTDAVNVHGFVTLCKAAQQSGVRAIVYASSSSVYGDNPNLPKVESETGNPLSPYAASKAANELYASSFNNVYGLSMIGLRYFNVFGPRQDPFGVYAAVIPRWIGELIRSEQCKVFGDGSYSRDFCFIENVVSANFLSAQRALQDEGYLNVFNVGTGNRTTLLDLYSLIKSSLTKITGEDYPEIEFAEPREGDVPHSLAAIDKISAEIGYKPLVDIRQGIEITAGFFASDKSS